MEIKTENGKSRIYSPYNPIFVEKIKQIYDAKWNREEKCWEVPEAAVDAVRNMMVSVYGYSDISENETIRLKVSFDEPVYSLCSDVIIFGKIFSHASGRDSGAKAGNDVYYISGGADSGGSVKNWRSIVKPGSVAIVENVNRNIYAKGAGEYKVEVEIIDGKPSKSSLLEEKNRLLKRIEEIDRLLNE